MHPEVKYLFGHLDDVEDAYYDGSPEALHEAAERLQLALTL